jgi:hypothetical protein
VNELKNRMIVYSGAMTLFINIYSSQFDAHLPCQSDSGFKVDRIHSRSLFPVAVMMIIGVTVEVMEIKDTAGVE